jgi:hypothetical protein
MKRIYVAFCITSLFFASCKKESDDSVCNCMSNSSPSLTVLTPQKGDTYTVGQRIVIKWKSCNVQNVYIGMAMGGHDMGLITKSEDPIPAAQGTYVWTVSAPFEDFHTGYVIGIWADENGHHVMSKSGSFNIN